MILTYLKIFIRTVIRLLVRVLYLVPVKRNLILFESFQGRSFSDNPREVWRYLREHCGDRFEYVCSLAHPGVLRDGGVRAVRYKSPAWLFCQIRAKVIVSNTLPITILPKRRGQMFIETWHGGGAYKTLSDDFRGYSKAKRVMIHWNNRLLDEKIDAFLSSSAAFSDAGILRPYQLHRHAPQRHLLRPGAGGRRR